MPFNVLRNEEHFYEVGEMEKENQAEGEAYTKQRCPRAESSGDGVGGEAGEVEGRQLGVKGFDPTH